MAKCLSICTYSNTTQRPVQSIFTQLNMYMSPDYDHFKTWKDINRQVMLADCQDSLQPPSRLVTYANESH